MEFNDWNQMRPEEISKLYQRKTVIGEQITVARIEVKQGATTQPHSHDSEEMVIVLEGAWKFSLPHGDIVLRANQMLTIPPGMVHSSETIEDTVALDICAPKRFDWVTGDDRFLHQDPDQLLWAV